ncbi:MAG TPA: diacylglycerol kinase family protein [Hyphomicrobium sp.]|nr:diacylglycerol kinase family protein [Hyphomicrobium sp.]
MRKSFALIFNARAGVARPKLLDGVIAELKAAGAHVFQLPARSAEEATQRVAELAQSKGADAVIAAGGDGTFRAVATGAAGSQMPVGFLPLGTGNVLAHEIGLHKNASALARGLITNPEIPIQGGTVNGQPFFLMAGAGFDARIVQALNFKTKRLVARAAYTAPVLKALSYGAEQFDVDVDGRGFSASWVIVTRAGRYGGSFVLSRDTRLGAATMVAVLIEAQSSAALAACSLALASGRLADPATRPRNVTMIPARRVVIGRRTHVPLQVDGDDAGTTPAEVVADGPVARIIVPPAYLDDLPNCHTNHLL